MDVGDNVLYGFTVWIDVALDTRGSGSGVPDEVACLLQRVKFLLRGHVLSAFFAHECFHDFSRWCPVPAKGGRVDTFPLGVWGVVVDPWRGDVVKAVGSTLVVMDVPTVCG